MAREFEMLLAELEGGPAMRRDPIDGRFEAAVREAFTVATRPTPMRKSFPSVDIAKLQRRQAAVACTIASLPRLDPEEERKDTLRKTIATVDGYAKRAIAIGRLDLAPRFAAYCNRLTAGTIAA